MTLPYVRYTGSPSLMSVRLLQTLERVRGFRLAFGVEHGGDLHEKDTSRLTGAAVQGLLPQLQQEERAGCHIL